LDTVVLRYFTVYGLRQRASSGVCLGPNLLDAVRRGRAFVDGDERSAEDLTYVTDVVAATLSAMRAPRAGGRVINVGSGQMVSIAELQGILTNLLGTSVKSGLRRSPDGPAYRICARTALASELLDFSPRVSLVGGLGELVRLVNEEETPALVTLAPVGLDD
jgi:nucleoside-diphosphate-sugar epimerase